MAEYVEGRRRELAKIHVAKKQLGLDDASYRDVLCAVAGVQSASELDASGRKAVLKHFERLGFVPRRGSKPHPGQPRNMSHEDRGPLLRKLEAYLAEGQKPWAYADSMARRMFGIERVAWCNSRQLMKIVQALEYHARRRAKTQGV